VLLNFTFYQFTTLACANSKNGKAILKVVDRLTIGHLLTFSSVAFLWFAVTWPPKQKLL